MTDVEALGSSSSLAYVCRTGSTVKKAASGSSLLAVSLVRQLKPTPSAGIVQSRSTSQLRGALREFALPYWT